MKKALLVVSLVAFFAAGYITGSIQTKNAIAIELGGLTGAGGTVESLKNLGKTIIEMQENVDKLQKNINTVKKVKDDISGYTGIIDKATGKTPATTPSTTTPAVEKGLKDYLK